MNAHAGRLIAPLIALGPAVAISLWAAPEGASFWRGLTIISAWAGSGLLAASMVLMLRDPRSARLFGGLENAYRWHHRSGMLAYLCLLLHPLALAVSAWSDAPYLAWQALSPWAQAWSVMLGWVSLLLLMSGLSATFALRLPYRRWRGLHYLLGLGVLVGLVHAYVLAGNIVPLIGLIVLTVLALAWRLAASDLGLASYPYRVTAVEHPAADMIEASLAPCASALPVTPGQFVFAAFGEGPYYRGCGEYHPFTVSGIDAEGRLRVTIKALGPCSLDLQDLEPGTLVRLQGPFGVFLTDSPQRPQLWVAGGIGITPFIAALRAQPRSQDTTLIYLFRDEPHAVFLDELQALAKADDQFELVALATGDTPPLCQALLQNISRLAEREVSICGPIVMVEMLTPHLLRAGIAESDIHFESFDFR